MISFEGGLIMKGKIILGILMLFLVVGFVRADMPVAGDRKSVV